MVYFEWETTLAANSWLNLKWIHPYVPGGTQVLAYMFHQTDITQEIYQS